MGIELLNIVHIALPVLNMTRVVTWGCCYTTLIPSLNLGGLIQSRAISLRTDYGGVVVTTILISR